MPVEIREVRQRAPLQLRRNRGRRAPHQHADLILRLTYSRFEIRNRRQRGAELRLRPLGIERGATPGLKPLSGQAEGPALILRVPDRYRELLLRSPQIKVRSRQLGREEIWTNRRSSWFASIERSLRLHVVSHPAEEIQFP